MATTQHSYNDVMAAIDTLIAYARNHLELQDADVDWARNAILAVCSLDYYEPSRDCHPNVDDVNGVLRNLIDALETSGLIESHQATVIADAVMGVLAARPSVVQRRFEDIERDGGSMAAMQWFYDYCVADTYVKRAQLDANPRFDSHGLTVTINQAKPEFRDMAKAAAGNSVGGGYPQCTICHENEGCARRDKRTLRTIGVMLGGEPWFWQFSPYGYFSQHGICVNMEHTPMHVDRDTFVRLLDFVDRFPGYFLGCNAALPRIGGSVLAHDHYQGGKGPLPMHKAAAWQTLPLDGAPDARVEILDWPGTAVRVVSRSRERIVEVSEHIRQGWVSYSNPDFNIACQGAQGEPQSALSPSVIMTNRGYEMNLILRNNAVSEQYPDGVFHVHPQYYCIKQEPIGLIEAQGLFILPGRLIDQLSAIEDVLAAGGGLPRQLSEFSLIWNELQAPAAGSSRAAIRRVICDELGSVAWRMLENTAVLRAKEDTRVFLQGLGLGKERP